HPLEVFEVGIGNQVVQVPQTHLILGKEDNVPGVAVIQPALGAQTHHGRVNLLKPGKLQLPELVRQLVEDEAAGDCIVSCPVVVEVRQAQGVGHHIQLEFIQVGQQILGENQGIHGGKAVGQALFPAGLPDEARVKVCI